MGKYVKTLSKSCVLGVDLLIFVILGTQDKGFDRMLKEIDELKKDGIITSRVVVQAGSTNFKSNEMDIIDYLPMQKFNEYIEEADIIITHGGVGSILDAIKHHKKVIAIPRLEKYHEHVNNHQIQIVEEFDRLGYIMDCGNLKRLGNKLMEIEKFTPTPFISNNKIFIHKLEEYIGD